MSFIEKELCTNEDSSKKAMQITMEISKCLSQAGINTSYAFPLIPYLLHKVSQYNNPLEITLQEIFDGKIKVDNGLLLLAKNMLNEKLWKSLLQLITKYSVEEFAFTAISTVPDNDPIDVVTPTSIINLVHKLLNVKAGEKVADVCCGKGTYIVSAALEESKAHYHGYEISMANRAVAIIKADLLGLDIEVTLCNVFSFVESGVKSGNMPKYDKIFANYPFGQKIKNLELDVNCLESLFKQNFIVSKATSSDWVFNALLCDMLTEKGKAIGIMTTGSTVNSIDIPMRKYFIENKLIESVIILPGKLFGSTSISTTLIVFSHNNESVRLIDATMHYQQGRRQNELSDENINTIIDALTTNYEYSKTFSIEELRNNEYKLNLSCYTAVDLKFQNGVPFESIIKSISRGAPCTASQLDKMISDDATNMQYLMLANIQDGIIDKNLPYLSYIDSKYKKYCLKNNSLILSKNGYPYKIAVVTIQEGQYILANGNLYIIELDESKVNPYFLMAFFDSESGNTALNNITVGSVIPNIGVDKLKKIIIPLPSLEEQEHIARKYQETQNEVLEIKCSLEKAVNKLHHIFDEKSN